MPIRHALIAFATLLALCLVSVTHQSVADMVTIGVGHQAADKQSLGRPFKGMEKHAVQSHFGNPRSQSAAVGEPPISHWVFEDFTVYFEYDSVIHTVLHDTNSKPIQ